MTDLVIRPLRAGEADLFLSMPVEPLVGVAITGRDYRHLAELGQYRPEWTWVALRGDRVVARAAWWAGPGDDSPMALDWFDIDEAETGRDTGAALLRAAGFDAELVLLLPPGWRDRPDVRDAAEARIAAARDAGMRPFVERFHYTWTPAAGLPERPGRLDFRPAPDDDGVLKALRGINDGTLDAYTLRDLEQHGVEGAAREGLEELKWYPAPREWWRLAYTPAGELAGLTVPSRNHASFVIGFVGVVAGQRGNGYGYDLLIEAAHRLVEEGATEIRADTDVGNHPMAAALARAGWPITQQRFVMR
jgi:RimJ/RimL family protein N-acetyltransferase